VPLRPLRLGDVFGGVLTAIRGNVGATIGLGFLTTAVFLVPLTALGAWLAAGEPLVLDSSAEGAEDVSVTALVGSFLPSLGTSFSSVLLAGFLAFVIGQGVLGRRVSAGRTWEGTRPHLLKVVGATLLTAAALLVVLAVLFGLPVGLLVAGTGPGAGGEGLFVGLLLLLLLAGVVAVAVALWLSTRLAFTTPAIVLEGAGVVTALRRSWSLTSGTPFWRILGIRLLAALVAGLVAQVLTFPVSILGTFVPLLLGDEARLLLWQAVTLGVSGLLTGALTTPFTAGVDALLYVDQRFRREGLDVEVMRLAAAPR
jgi:hypothetical protein